MSDRDQYTGRRRYLRVLSAVGAAGIAGCGVLSDDDGAGNGRSNDDRRGDADGNGTDENGDDDRRNGDQTGRDLDPDSPVTIGHVGPAGNVMGIGSERAAQMAIDEVNDAGGVGGEPLELVVGDTRSTPTEAETVVENMITRDGVDVIVGSFLSEVARGIIDVTSEFDVPFLSTGPADPNLTRDFTRDDYDTYRNYFRIGPVNTDFQAEAMADYCTHLSDLHGWNALTFYRDQAAWTDPFAELVPDMLTAAGLEIADQDAIPIDQPDLSPIVTETAASGADYMLRFFAHIDNSPSGILAPWRIDELEFGIEGIHVPGTHPEYDIATEGINVYETNGQAGGGGVAPITEETVPFVTRYRERFDRDQFDVNTPDGSPMAMGFGTYDAVRVVAEAIESAGVSPAEDLDAFVDAMLGIEHTGVSGEISFFGPDSEFPHDLQPTRTTDGAIMNFPITQTQPNTEDERPGQVECVFPGPVETAQHLQPEWMQ